MEPPPRFKFAPPFAQSSLVSKQQLDCNKLGASKEEQNTALELTPEDSTEEMRVDLEVKEVLEELVQALELHEEESQQTAVAVAPTLVTPKRSAKRAVSWNAQIETVKDYEITLEERRYKRSLWDFIRSKGPSPWTSPVNSAPSRHPQRAHIPVKMPYRC